MDKTTTLNHKIYPYVLYGDGLKCVLVSKLINKCAFMTNLPPDTFHSSSFI